MNEVTRLDNGLTFEEEGAVRIRALLGEISGTDPERIYCYAYVLMDPDGHLCTGTNAVGRESVHAMLSRAAEEWPA